MRKIFVLLFCLLSVKLFATDCRTTYGISPSIIATASCDINVNDKTVGGNATGGAITFTLDNCASSTKDVTHFFWKTDSSGNAVTLDGYSAQTVNGSATFSLPTQYTAARLRCQGNGNWIIESGSLSVIGSGSIGSTSITPGADDTMLVSNGSAFQNKTIPACTDTGGNHLNYDQATNSLSCGTSGGAATGLTVGSTSIASGTSGRILYDNAGTLGELSTLSTFESDIESFIDVEDLQYTDNTTNDSSTSKHGLLKKLDNDAAHFINGQGAWVTPSGSSTTDYIRVRYSTTISTSNTVTTLMTWDTEDFKSGISHSNVTNNSRLTANSSGWYSGYCTILFAANTTGARFVSVRLNAAGSSTGGTEISSVRIPPSSSTPQISTPIEYYLNSTDYLECFAFQDSGGNLNVGGSSRQQFAMHRN